MSERKLAEKRRALAADGQPSTPSAPDAAASKLADTARMLVASRQQAAREVSLVRHSLVRHLDQSSFGTRPETEPLSDCTNWRARGNADRLLIVGHDTQRRYADDPLANSFLRTYPMCFFSPKTQAISGPPPLAVNVSDRSMIASERNLLGLLQMGNSKRSARTSELITNVLSLKPHAADGSPNLDPRRQSDVGNAPNTKKFRIFGSTALVAHGPSHPSKAPAESTDAVMPALVRPAEAACGCCLALHPHVPPTAFADTPTPSSSSLLYLTFAAALPLPQTTGAVCASGPA